MVVMQALINGLVAGGIYVLIASGLALLYGVSRIFNLAHVEILMAGGYLVIFLVGTTFIPVPVAALAALVLAGAFGFGMDRVLIRPLRLRAKSDHDALLGSAAVTLGVSFVIANVVLALFGANVLKVPQMVGGLVTIGPVRLTGQQLLILGVSVVAIGLLFLMLTRTRLGLAMRAVSQNADAAELSGVNKEFVFAITLAISTVLAVLAGILLGPIYYLYPFMGVSWLVKALIIVLVGGLGSIEGAIVAGFGLAMIESFLASFVNLNVATVSFFVVAVIMLVFRPQGIFAKGGRLL